MTTAADFASQGIAGAPSPELASLLEAAKAALAAISEDQRQSAQALVDIHAKLAEVTGVATAALAAQTQVTAEQAVIATRSDHIQDAQGHADKVRGDLDRALTSAAQQAGEAESSATRAQSASDGAVQTAAEISGLKETAQEALASIVKEREAATTASGVAKSLATRAATIDERVAAYEARLEELERLSKHHLETIVGLLPGATSAGLAHAFDARRQSFLDPAKRWQWVFVGSLAFLVVLALTGLWGVYRATTVTYDDLLRLWIARLPIAAALVWLALHSSRESALAKRLEEDYGYKAAIASTFQGFHRQMSEIGESASTNLALSKLYEDTLATIASPPGRIYEKHKLAATPSDELIEAAKAVVSRAKPDTKST